MKLLRAQDYKIVPWKNGGGRTAEIAVFPPNATMEEFDWRLSMADVASDGPFSVFPDIDRTLTLLEGEGMALEIEGRDSVVLDPASAPLAFPGDVPVMARLVGGPIRDLNVMSRRGRYTHRVERLEIDGSRTLEVTAELAVLFCVEGNGLVGGEAMGRHDALLTGAGPLVISGAGRFCLVLLQNG